MIPSKSLQIDSMHTLNEMTALAKRFRQVLELRHGLLICYRKYGVQIEGWLKGELLYFLDREKATGRLLGFDREVSLS